MPIHKRDISFFKRQRLGWLLAIVVLLISIAIPVLYSLDYKRSSFIAVALLIVITIARLGAVTVKFISLRSRQDVFFARLRWWHSYRGLQIVNAVVAITLGLGPLSTGPVIVFDLNAFQLSLVFYFFMFGWNCLDLTRYVFVDSNGIHFAGVKGISVLKWYDIVSIRCLDDRIDFETRVSYKESVIRKKELRKADDVEWLKQELLQRADLHNIPFEKVIENQNADSTQET